MRNGLSPVLPGPPRLRGSGRGPGRSRRWRVGLGLGLLACLGVICDARAEAPSALVLEKHGPSEPEVSPYSEVPVGTSVSLSPRTRLVFVHYETCRTVTVVGGKVTFRGETYTLSGGLSSHEVPTPCPRTVRLKGGSTAGGGTIVRDIPGSLKLSTAPAFMVIGARAGDFMTVRISRAGGVLLDAPLTGRSFRWPAGTTPLTANADYEITLVPRVQGQAPAQFKFRAEDSAAGSADSPTLIRLDE